MRIYAAKVFVLGSMLLSCKPSADLKEVNSQSAPAQSNVEMFAAPLKVATIVGKLDDEETAKFSALSNGQVFMLECDDGSSPISAKWLNRAEASSLASLPADAVLVACDSAKLVTTDPFAAEPIGLALQQGGPASPRRASPDAVRGEDGTESATSVGGWNRTPTQLFGIGSAAYTATLNGWSVIRAKAGYEIPVRRREMYEVIDELGFDRALPGSPAAAVASAARLYGGVVSKETSDRADPLFIQFFRENSDLMQQDTPDARRVWAEAEHRIMKEHGGWIIKLSDRILGVSGRVAYANAQKARAIPLYKRPSDDGRTVADVGAPKSPD